MEPGDLQEKWPGNLTAARACGWSGLSKLQSPRLLVWSVDRPLIDRLGDGLLEQTKVLDAI